MPYVVGAGLLTVLSSLIFFGSNQESTNRTRSPRTRIELPMNNSVTIDETVSEALLIARRDRRMRGPFLEQIFKELKEKNQGAIQHLGVLRYDPGTRQQEYFADLGKRINRNIRIGTREGGEFSTVDAGYRFVNDPIICFAYDSVFEPVNHGAVGRLLYTDADIKRIVASHEAKHAEHFTQGLPLSIKDRYKLAERIGFDKLQLLEEHLCRYQELKDVAEGTAQASMLSFRACIAEFGAIKTLTQRLLGTPADQYAREVLDYTKDLKLLSAFPYVELVD